MSASPEKWPSCLSASPKVPQWVRTPISGLGPTPETLGGWAGALISAQLPGSTDKKHLGVRATGSVAGCPHSQTQSWGSAANPSPKQRSATHPDQQPGCLQATTPKSTSSEKLLPRPSAQNPAGPTGSLGGRQNAQQRGAAGLGETAFPCRTRPHRGLNYPIAAPRAPSI